VVGKLFSALVECLDLINEGEISQLCKTENKAVYVRTMKVHTTCKAL